MSKKKAIWCALAAALGVLALCLALFGRYRSDGLTDSAVRDAGQRAAEDWGGAEPAATLFAAGDRETSATGDISGTFTVPEPGQYEVWVRCRAEGRLYTALSPVFTLDGGTYEVQLPVIWTEETGPRPLDRYGDEMNSAAGVADLQVENPLLLRDDVGGRRLTVELEAGEHAFALAGCEGAAVYGVYVSPAGADRQPLDVRSQGEGGTALIAVEAENYLLKSDSYIRGKNVKNAALTPYESLHEKINVIDSQSWSRVGQKLLWVFSVEEAGYYRLAFRYSQYSEADKQSYRTVRLDGRELPGGPAAFPSTGLNDYKNLTLQYGDGDMWVYLGAGEHTLTMEAVMDPLLGPYEELLAIMREINDIAMDLRKLTAGNRDANRTWDMDQYLPEVPGELEHCREEIAAVYDELYRVGGRSPSYASRLSYAVQLLDNILEDKRLIPNKTGMLSEGDGSVNSALGEVLEKLVDQPLSLDRIYFYQDTDLPASDVNIFVSTVESLKRLVATYLPGYAGADYAAGSGDGEELEVWVNMSVSYTEVLQQLLDETYNAEHGANIRLALMPNEQKLILSNATNSNPDVVLGVNFFTPYELAIRGAAKNLLEYPDFSEFYSSQYNVAGLTPLAYDGGIYGAVDSLNYQVLFYRKDILDSLGLEVPETWKDVQDMMPVLHRYSMNFYISLAASTSFKTFNMTGPFIYENGGTFYSADGTGVAFNDAGGQEGLRQMTELFDIYSMSQSVANFFNSFRYGDIPLGVGNFATYIQLQTAAPELEGQWGIALIPGQLKDDGTVVRDQAADSTASMIFSNTDKPDEAWEFLKWWLSAETQTTFSNRLERAYGAAYRWNTANLTAFESLPYPEEHKAVILEQVSYQKETPRHPAGYMVEREVSNIWNQVVVNGAGLTESIDRAAIASDREIERKLKEFGFIDENGNLIKPYTTADVREWMGLEGEE